MKRAKLRLKDVYELMNFILAKVIETMRLENYKIWNLLDYLRWLFYPKITFRIWNTQPLQKH